MIHATGSDYEQPTAREPQADRPAVRDLFEAHAERTAPDCEHSCPDYWARAGLVLSTGLSDPGILKGSTRAHEGQLPPPSSPIRRTPQRLTGNCCVHGTSPPSSPSPTTRSPTGSGAAALAADHRTSTAPPTASATRWSVGSTGASSGADWPLASTSRPTTTRPP